MIPTLNAGRSTHSLSHSFSGAGLCVWLSWAFRPGPLLLGLQLGLLTTQGSAGGVCFQSHPGGCWQDSGPHRLLDWGPQFLPDWRPEAALLHKAAYNIPKSKLARELKRPNKTEARIFGNQILEGTSRFYPLKRVTGSNPHLKVGNYGIPLSHKKEWNNAICRNRDRPRD